MKLEMVLEQQKQTKNKIVYGAEGAPIPSVYIEKSALPTAPLTIKVTVESEV